MFQHDQNNKNGHMNKIKNININININTNMNININIKINTGSTIQGDHILAFWQTQKFGSIPNEGIWNTKHSVFRDMYMLFNNFMARYL